MPSSSYVAVINLKTGDPVTDEGYWFYESDDRIAACMRDAWARLESQGFTVLDSIHPKVKIAIRDADRWALILAPATIGPERVLVESSGTVFLSAEEAAFVLRLIAAESAAQVDVQESKGLLDNLSSIEKMVHEGWISRINLKYLLYTMLSAEQAFEKDEQRIAKNIVCKLISPLLMLADTSIDLDG